MQLFKERNGVYYVTHQQHGRQIRRSLKTKSKHIAKQRLAKYELEFHEAQLFGREPERGFRQLMETYLEARKNTRGFQRLQSGVKPLLAFFGNSELSAITPAEVERYVAWRSGKVKDGTIKRETGILMAAFNHAIKKHGWKVANPCTSADLPSDPRGRVRYLTHPEASRLIQAARHPIMTGGRPLGVFNKSPVLADFIELALNTGCRKQELLGLKWSDVDLSTRLLRLAHTKAGRWQTVPINEEARKVILRRMRRRNEVCPESPYVFFHEVQRGNARKGGRVHDLKKSFKAACKQAEISDFRIHDLRHTFASWLVMEGVSLFKVSKLLRHETVAMTERYAHLSPDHLHDAIERVNFSAENQRSPNVEAMRSTKRLVL